MNIYRSLVFVHLSKDCSSQYLKHWNGDLSIHRVIVRVMAVMRVLVIVTIGIISIVSNVLVYWHWSITTIATTVSIVDLLWAAENGDINAGRYLVVVRVLFVVRIFAIMAIRIMSVISNILVNRNWGITAIATAISIVVLLWAVENAGGPMAF